MSTPWIASYLALWVVVFILITITLALARQVGFLFARVPDRSSRFSAVGPAVGARIQKTRVTDLRGREIRVPDAQAARTILLCISPFCNTCGELAPALVEFCKNESHRGTLLLVGIFGSEEKSRGFATQHGLTDIPYTVSNPLIKALDVRIGPFAIVVDRVGTVLAKGVVNHKEHIYGLLGVEARGTAPATSQLHDAPPTL